MAFFSKPPFGKPIEFKSSKPKPRPHDPCRELASPHDPDNVMGADEMVSQFVNIKKCYRTEIGRLADAKGDRHARRFYCADDCAFIFDVEYLEAMVKAIRQHPDPTKQDGCMVLFQGLIEESIGNKPFGRPTLIATAYVINGDNLEHTKISLPVSTINLQQAGNDLQQVTEELHDGLEHPGNGSSPSALKFSLKQNGDNQVMDDLQVDSIWPESLDESTPDVLQRGEPTDPTDYSIRTSFPWKDLGMKWR